MRIEQAAWVKPGVRVRWKGSPFGVGGVVFPIPAGPHVEVGVLYDGSSVVWEGDVASSWEPAAGAELTPSFMLDGGPCAKPESRGDVCGDHVGRVRSEACYVCKAGPMVPCHSTAAPSPSPSPASFKIKPGASWGDLLKAHPPTTPVQVAVGTTVIDLNHIHAHGEQASRHVSTMEQVIARLDAIDAALKPLAHLAPRGISDERVVDMSRDVTPHLARTRAATSAGFADPSEIACPVCGIVRWGQCRAVVGLDPLPSTTSSPAPEGQAQAATQGHSESATPTDHTRLPTAPPNVPVHSERYTAAREAMYYDTYGAACPRCKAPRWGGCVAVDGEPTDVAPDQAILVRVEYQNGDHVFHHISWPSDQLVAVARGFFEACSALECDVTSAPRRPGLERVARSWDSLTKVEQDYWCNVVRGFLDRSSDPGLSTVEEVVLGAMVRVFGLERAGRS